MQVGVIGAGAIGGWLTAGCVDAGASVTVLARGASFEALRQDGLCIDNGTAQKTYAINATKDAADLRGVDVLVLGLKAHDLPTAAPLIEAAMDNHTIVVPAINGLPWWFFDSFGGPAQGVRIDAVDPGGVLSDLMPSDRVVGSVVYAASFVSAPGKIRLINANTLWLGDVGGGNHAKVLAEFFNNGDIPAVATKDLHWQVWNKLWGNANANPLSALTRADIAQLYSDEYVVPVAKSVMQEMSDLGTRIGLPGFDDIDRRINDARQLGAFKTSMLQDVEAGRPIELEPILGGLVELARHLDHPTPMMDTLYGLARLLDRNLRD